MQRNFIILVAGAAAALAGCATMSPEECAVADWRALGAVDGERGETLATFENRQQTCAKNGIVADFDAYKLGRADGLVSFCRPERAFQFGLDGGAYRGVCPAETDTAFRMNWERGYAVYQAKSAFESARSSLESLYSRRDSVEKKMRDNEIASTEPNITPELRKYRLSEVDRFRRERNEIEREIRDKTYDVRFRAEELSRLRLTYGVAGPQPIW